MVDSEGPGTTLASRLPHRREEKECGKDFGEDETLLAGRSKFSSLVVNDSFSPYSKECGGDLVGASSR